MHLLILRQLNLQHNERHVPAFKLLYLPDCLKLRLKLIHEYKTLETY